MFMNDIKNLEKFEVVHDSDGQIGEQIKEVAYQLTEYIDT